MTKISNKPKCPNHACELEIQNLQEGLGKCPVSGAEFTFTAKAATIRKAKGGGNIVEFEVCGDDT